MIDAEKIISSVHTRTYYLAERKKRDDVSFSFIQTSVDNDDILREFLETVLNEVKGRMIKRTLSFSLDINTGKIEVISTRKKAEVIIPLLDKSIEDYLVEYILQSWLKYTAPELFDPTTLQNKSEEVDKYISMLSPMPRRRATDLAGI